MDIALENHASSNLFDLGLLVVAAEAADFLGGQDSVVENEPDAEVKGMLVEERHCAILAVFAILLLQAFFSGSISLLLNKRIRVRLCARLPIAGLDIR